MPSAWMTSSSEEEEVVLSEEELDSLEWVLSSELLDCTDCSELLDCVDCSELLDCVDCSLCWLEEGEDASEEGVGVLPPQETSASMAHVRNKVNGLRRRRGLFIESPQSGRAWGSPPEIICLLSLKIII